MGLPTDLKVLLSDGETAFVNRGESVISHGGSAIEEVVVPFIKLTKGK
jgi:hypothetical protein